MSAAVGEVIDVRDVIAQRLEALLKPCRALEQLATRNEGLPGRAEALNFCAQVEHMVERYAHFVEADAKAAEAELIEQMNALEVTGDQVH